LTDQQGHVIAG